MSLHNFFYCDPRSASFIKFFSVRGKQHQRLHELGSEISAIVLENVLPVARKVFVVDNIDAVKEEKWHAFVPRCHIINIGEKNDLGDDRQDMTDGNSAMIVVVEVRPKLTTKNSPTAGVELMAELIVSKSMMSATRPESSYGG
ncbi:hypothetical protein FDECE_14645 [Fusarium decemcellulare]|nr:hypothetical protein FDECE_14645 [Fusarium decemcellulare]